MQTKSDFSNSTIGTFKTHLDAENAVKELQKAGFKMNQLSLVGKDYHTEENVVGYYNTGDRMKFWGKLGAFWGGMWGLLFGSAFFMVPGVGPLLVAGPLVATIVGGLEGAALTAGVSALGAAFFSLGIPKNSIIRYETAIKGGQYVLVAHGNAQQVETARGVLKNSNALEAIETFSNTPAKT